jgi:S-adenosylmethionine decarboxylase proenzyme
MQQNLGGILQAVKPNLFLIGAMSICMRGAVEAAKLVRAALGDSVCIVLGGRHPTETIYRDPKAGAIAHHISSPLRLIAEGDIPEDIFDVVIAGDGEFVIAELGELVASLVSKHRAPILSRSKLDALAYCPGDWVAGSVRNKTIRTICSTGIPIDYNNMPSPAAMFGINTAFAVFGGAPTAHVFSDIGYGCIYDCGFCSERISVVGAPRQMKSSGFRLYGQLAAARQVINEDYSPDVRASAFVEDSTLLGWNPALIQQLEEGMNAAPIDIQFGGQATIDQILQRPALAQRLRKLGLEYLFIGLETPRPEVVGGLHKDFGNKNGSWMERAERALNILRETGISAGLSLLFGLGEGRREREFLFLELDRWKRRNSHCPVSISMNWAVQHPLRGSVMTPQYKYLNWAIERGPMLALLRHFGEASECYPIAGGTKPAAEEVKDIIVATDAILGRDDALLVPRQPNTQEIKRMMQQTPRGSIRRIGADRSFAGTHLFIDMWEATNTDNTAAVTAAVEMAVRDAKATLLDSCFRKYGEGGGITGFAILAESHICVNTWHEEKMVAVDVFFCGALDPYACVSAFQQVFEPLRTDISEHKRLLGTRQTHPQFMT